MFVRPVRPARSGTPGQERRSAAVTQPLGATLLFDVGRGLVLDDLPGPPDGPDGARVWPFEEWCRSPHAALRWLQLAAAQPGETVIVERGDALGTPDLVEMSALEAPSPEMKRFAVRPIGAEERQHASFRTISHHVMSLLTSLVLIVDQAGRVSYAGERTRQLLGYDPAELLAQPLELLLGAEGTAQFRRDLIGGSRPDQRERVYPVGHRDGSARTLEIVWTDLLRDPVVNGVLLVARDVSAEQRARQDLEDQQEFYQAILQDLPYQVAVLDQQGRYRYLNPAAVANPEVRAGIIGRTDEEYCAWRGHDPGIAATRRERFQQAAASGAKVSWQETMFDPLGRPKTHQRHYLPIFGAGRRLTRMIGYGEDATDRLRNAAMSARQTRILELAARGAPLAEVLAEIRAALHEYVPWAQATLHTGPAYDLFVRQGATGNTVVPIVVDRQTVGVLCLGVPRPQVGGPGTEPLRVMEHLARLAAVVIERSLHIRRLEEAAYVDPLTGLPNRAAFVRTLAQAPARPGSCTVIVADLKRFGQLNDRYGYSTGDAVLVQLARRLEGCLPDGGCAARIGGDMFGLLVPAISAEETLGCVSRSFEPPFVVRGESIYLGAYVGLGPQDDREGAAGARLQQAEHAARRARQLGQAVSRYDEGHHTEELTALVLEGELRQTFREGGLSLVFQPLVEARSQALHSMEVLLRWIHPVRGAVSPEVFIRIAEQSDLMLDIGRWVLHEACRQAAGWPGGPLRVNVNVSARQFEQLRFVDDVRAALEASGLPADHLELELTENVLMTSGRAVIQVMEDLDRLRVRLALDDYGTGYSSLAYLKRFPLDVLKIDRTFVVGLGEERPDAGDLAIVRSTIALAHDLGLTVVAEGVESQRQREVLTDLGCDLLQGYLFSPPMPVAQARVWKERIPSEGRTT